MKSKPDIKRTFFLGILILNVFILVSGQQRSATNIIIRNKVFEDAQIKAYFENPRLYEANKRALEGPEEAAKVQSELYYRRIAQQATRMSPGAGGVVDIGGVFRERGLIFWEENEHEYKIKKQREMAENPEEIKKVARLYRERLYDSREEPYIKDHYQRMHLYEGENNKLPNPVALDGLKLQYPEIVSIYDNDVFTNSQKESLCKGEMDKREYMQILGLNNDEFEKHLSEKFGITLPVQDAIFPVLQSDLNEVEIENQRKSQLASFQKNTDDARSNFYAGTAILSLIDPEVSQKLITAGDAAFSIYESVGTMVINNTLDPTNFSNLTNGVGTLISLFGNTPNSEHIMIEMLSEILNNQKTIILQLKNLEIKIAELQASVNYLIDIVQKNHKQTIHELQIISKTLKNIEQKLVENKDYQRLLNQELITRDFEREKASLINPFKNQIGSQLHTALIEKLNNPRKKNIVAEMHFSQINQLLGKLHFFATRQLKDPNYLTFTDRSDISELSYEDIKAKEQLDVTQIMGMLPKMGEWLNRHVNSSTPLVAYSDSFLGKKPDGLNLKVRIGNPAIFAHILDEYVELALYRPVEKSFGSIIRDNNMDDFCEDALMIESTFDKMRENIPLALAVVNFHLKNLSVQHNDFVTNEGSILNLILIDEQNDSIKEKPRIFLNHVHKDSLYEEITKYPTVTPVYDDIYQLGVKMGIFKITKFTYYSHDPFGNYDFQGFVTVLELTPELALKYNSSKFYYHNCRIWPRQKQEDEDYINKYYPNRNLPVTSGDSPRDAFERSTRDNLLGIFIQETLNRQKELSQNWGKLLKNNSNQNILNLYRAIFLFKTLVYGGYGKTFRFAPELKDLITTYDKIDSIWRFIEEKWINGEQVIDDFPGYTLELERFFDHGQPAWKALQIKLNEKQSLGKPNIIETFLQDNASFVSNIDSSTHNINYKALVYNIKMPMHINNPFITEGEFSKVYHVLKISSVYADIAPSKALLEKFKHVNMVVPKNKNSSNWPLWLTITFIIFFVVVFLKYFRNTSQIKRTIKSIFVQKS